MAEKKKYAFFPITDRTIPIVRFLNEHSQDCQIVALISFLDIEYCGYDGAYADLGKELGLPVFSSIESSADLWDGLIVADEESITNLRLKDDKHICLLMQKAIERGKTVICSREISETSKLKLKDLADSNHVEFMYLYKDKAEIPTVSGRLEKLNAFYAVFGSVIGDASSLTVVLKCVEQMHTKCRVSVVSTDINAELYGAHSICHIIRSRLSESAKIYAINSYLKSIELKEKPTIVLVLMLEPIVEYSETVPNDFGIIPFLLSKAIPTDFFECSVPYDLSSDAFILNMSDGIEKQNGYPIDAVHFSNVVIDYTLVDEQGFISAAYIPTARIKERTPGDTDTLPFVVFNWTDDGGIKRLVSHIEKEMQSI